MQLTSAGPTAGRTTTSLAGDPETYAQMTTSAGLREVAEYATVLGPDMVQILPRDAAGVQLGADRAGGRRARAGLDVVPYTFRAENTFLPAQFRSGTDPQRLR